jgi:putative nucleotidyltransferase with HDIG domain
MEAEVDRARKFCSAAKEQVKLMYDDVRLGKAIDSTIIMPLIGEIDSMVQSNSSAILSVARLKTHDDYTYMHSVAVCALMLSLAHQLNLDEEQTRLAGIGGLMHDLGKAFMSVDILNKPGKLTDAEFISVRKHPEAGAKVLEDNGAEPEVIDIALHHHEKVNGSGYPHGLLGEEISFLSRMGAICDVYDAVTSLRAYKKPWDPSNAIRTMAQWDGHFDKNIFNAFVKTVGIYPVGSLVRLSSKRLAVVIEPGKESLLKPKIKVFFSLGANAHIPVQTIDLAATTCNVTIEGPEDPETWGFKSLDDLWQ